MHLLFELMVGVSEGLGRRKDRGADLRRAENSVEIYVEKVTKEGFLLYKLLGRPCSEELQLWNLHSRCKKQKLFCSSGQTTVEMDPQMICLQYNSSTNSISHLSSMHGQLKLFVVIKKLQLIYSECNFRYMAWALMVAPVDR